MTPAERIRRLSEEVRKRQRFVDSLPRPCPPHLRDTVRAAIEEGEIIRKELTQARREGLIELRKLERMREGLKSQLPARRPFVNCVG